MGMWISLTKNPIKPIIRNPIPTARAIAVNSLRSGLVHFLTKCIESLANCFNGSIKTYYGEEKAKLQQSETSGPTQEQIKYITHLLESFFFRHV
jgi:hypothetical protein